MVRRPHTVVNSYNFDGDAPYFNCGLKSSLQTVFIAESLTAQKYTIGVAELARLQTIDPQQFVNLKVESSPNTIGLSLP